MEAAGRPKPASAWKKTSRSWRSAVGGLRLAFHLPGVVRHVSSRPTGREMAAEENKKLSRQNPPGVG